MKNASGNGSLQQRAGKWEAIASSRLNDLADVWKSFAHKQTSLFAGKI
ncbi:hypothetical protein NC997_03420 [Trichocoleus sp. DQ-A2]|nr:hypothetical protein [Coleofasciculus sp. FACHB-T130]